MEEPIIFLSEEQEISRKLEEKLEGKVSVSYYDYLHHELERLNSKEIEIMPVFLDEKKSRTGWYVLVDKKKLESQDNLEIEVPKQMGLEAIFRGNNSWQEMAWKERLRLKELKVVGV